MHERQHRIPTFHWPPKDTPAPLSPQRIAELKDQELTYGPPLTTSVSDKNIQEVNGMLAQPLETKYRNFVFNLSWIRKSLAERIEQISHDENYQHNARLHHGQTIFASDNGQALTIKSARGTLHLQKNEDGVIIQLQEPAVGENGASVTKNTQAKITENNHFHFKQTEVSENKAEKLIAVYAITDKAHMLNSNLYAPLNELKVGLSFFVTLPGL